MMLKALFRKQMMEFGVRFLRDRRTGAQSMAVQLVPAGYGQLYFAMMALIALAFGVFGSVFNTYAGLYQAKDNDLLLSMPIPPSRILLARLTSVALLGLLYQSLVWIPAILAYHLNAGFSPVPLILQLTVGLFLAMAVTALTCLLGWIVALISARLKNKSFITVLLFLIFFAGYYVLYGNAYRILAAILANADAVGDGVRSWAYPFWQAGGGAVGHPLPLLIFAVIASLCAALTWILLERSFIRIATTSRGTAKKVYREKAVRQGSVRSALFRKELKRFTSSAAYMLNCGLGTAFLTALAVALLIFAGQVREGMDLLLDGEDTVRQFLPHIAAFALCLTAAMNDITAPSVSMEGKTLWIVRSCPVRPWDALAAKLQLHVVLTLIPQLAAGIVCCVVLGLSLPASLLTLTVCAAFTVLTASAGLCLNLLSPNLSWTNETVPLKNSIPVFVMLFGSWGFLAVMAAGVYALSLLLSPALSLAAAAVLVALFAVLLLIWLRKKGTALYEGLGG